MRRTRTRRSVPACGGSGTGSRGWRHSSPWRSPESFRFVAIAARAARRARVATPATRRRRGWMARRAAHQLARWPLPMRRANSRPKSWRRCPRSPPRSRASTATYWSASARPVRFFARSIAVPSSPPSSFDPPAVAAAAAEQPSAWEVLVDRRFALACALRFPAERQRIHGGESRCLDSASVRSSRSRR